MPTAKECKCCREYDEYMAKMNAIPPVVGCIAAHPGFAGVCLQRTAYKVYRQQYGNIIGDMNR